MKTIGIIILCIIMFFLIYEEIKNRPTKKKPGIKKASKSKPKQPSFEQAIQRFQGDLAKGQHVIVGTRNILTEGQLIDKITPDGSTWEVEIKTMGGIKRRCHVPIECIYP